MMKKGCYIFKTDNDLTFYLPLNSLPVCRLRFIIKERKESVFYYFYGLDYEKEEPELENQLLDYFKLDFNYDPLDVHPCLQGRNFDRIKRYPKLYNRIMKLDVKYDERDLDTIMKEKSKM
jgi:hypothetical protein